MKINRTKNSGYIEGDNVLHKLKAETKIIAALFLMLGSGIGNGWVLNWSWLAVNDGSVCCPGGS